MQPLEQAIQIIEASVNGGDISKPDLDRLSRALDAARKRQKTTVGKPDQPVVKKGGKR